MRLRDYLPEGFPRVICLCGSTRFMNDYVRVTREETLKGNIVISVGMFGHQEGLDMEGDTKKNLDVLHLRKIDMADAILVVNGKTWVCSDCKKPCESTEWCLSYCCAEPCDKKSYVGESTKREIQYAKEQGKEIIFMNPVE